MPSDEPSVMLGRYSSGKVWHILEDRCHAICGRETVRFWCIVHLLLGNGPGDTFCKRCAAVYRETTEKADA